MVAGHKRKSLLEGDLNSSVSPATATV